MSVIAPLQEKQLFQASSQANIQLAFANPVTAGSSIHVGIRCANSGVSYTCSDNVNGSYGSPLNTMTDAAGGHASAHFRFANSGSGTITVTVTPNSAQGFMFVTIREIGQTTGFDVSAAHENNAVGTGADAVTSNNATPSVQPGLISAFVLRLIGSGKPTVGTGFTGGITTDAGMQTEHRRYTSLAAAAATVTNTVGGDDIGVMAAWFKENAAGAGFILSAAAGVYAYTGVNASLLWAPTVYTLLAAPGNYSYAGAESTADYVLNAATGVYGYSGVNAQAIHVSASLSVDPPPYWPLMPGAKGRGRM